MYMYALTLSGIISTHRAEFFTLVRISIGINFLRTHIHEIIIHRLTAKGQQFQRFIGAGSRQDGIGRCDGWDDILDDT